jgi:hypothetical protein
MSKGGIALVIFGVYCGVNAVIYAVSNSIYCNQAADIQKKYYQDLLKSQQKDEHIVRA